MQTIPLYFFYKKFTYGKHKIAALIKIPLPKKYLDSSCPCFVNCFKDVARDCKLWYCKCGNKICEIK